MGHRDHLRGTLLLLVQQRPAVHRHHHRHRDRLLLRRVRGQGPRRLGHLDDVHDRLLEPVPHGPRREDLHHHRGVPRDRRAAAHRPRPGRLHRRHRSLPRLQGQGVGRPHHALRDPHRRQAAAGSGRPDRARGPAGRRPAGAGRRSSDARCSHGRRGSGSLPSSRCRSCSRRSPGSRCRSGSRCRFGSRYRFGSRCRSCSRCRSGSRCRSCSRRRPGSWRRRPGSWRRRHARPSCWRRRNACSRSWRRPRYRRRRDACSRSRSGRRLGSCRCSLGWRCAGRKLQRRRGRCSASWLVHARGTYRLRAVPRCQCHEREHARQSADHARQSLCDVIQLVLGLWIAVTCGCFGILPLGILGWSLRHPVTSRTRWRTLVSRRVLRWRSALVFYVYLLRYSNYPAHGTYSIQ